MSLVLNDSTTSTAALQADSSSVQANTHSTDTYTLDEQLRTSLSQMPTTSMQVAMLLALDEHLKSQQGDAA